MKRFILLTTCMCGITVCFLVIAFMAIPAGRIGDISSHYHPAAAFTRHRHFARRTKRKFADTE